MYKINLSSVQDVICPQTLTCIQRQIDYFFQGGTPTSCECLWANDIPYTTNLCFEFNLFNNYKQNLKKKRCQFFLFHLVLQYTVHFRKCISTFLSWTAELITVTTLKRSPICHFNTSRYTVVLVQSYFFLAYQLQVSIIKHSKFPNISKLEKKNIIWEASMPTLPQSFSQQAKLVEPGTQIATQHLV